MSSARRLEAAVESLDDVVFTVRRNLAMRDELEMDQRSPTPATWMVDHSQFPQNLITWASTNGR